MLATHQQIELFGSADRLPQRPYCADDLAAGLRIRSLAQALTKPYLQVNPPHLRVWSIFDVDRHAAVLAWEDAGLPPPAWAVENRQNGHAHIVYGLSAPVLMAGEGVHDKPMRWLAAEESLMRELLQADSGYSGLITKNPMHPLWRTLQGPPAALRGYTLAELAEYLPGLEKHVPKRGKVIEYGVGRNVALFDWLRQYAYRHIRRAKAEGKLTDWRDHLHAKALLRNGEFRVPLHETEVAHIAKSVAKWTWHRFDLAERDAKFSALQAHRGRKASNQAEAGKASALARHAAREDRRATAILMRAKGMTYAQIGAELGVSERSAWGWCNA